MTTLRPAVAAASASASSVVLSTVLTLGCLVTTLAGGTHASASAPRSAPRWSPRAAHAVAPAAEAPAGSDAAADPSKAWAWGAPDLSELPLTVPALESGFAEWSDDVFHEMSHDSFAGAFADLADATGVSAVTSQTDLAGLTDLTDLTDLTGHADVRPPQLFTGQAFDTCSAPSLDALRAWRSGSPYGAMGIYIGGNNRGCAQPRLSSDWTHSAAAQGWQLLPLYVGSQAPCLSGSHKASRIDPRHALSQGAAEGSDAVRSAVALGLESGSPVYLDMESYPRDGASCTLAVLQYTSAWTQTLRSAGYLAGFYSSADSGIADLAAVALRRRLPSALPDVIWYARWDDRASTDGYRALGHGQWSWHRRVHQFTGNTLESHGGVRLTIDRNAVDAPVAIVH